MIKPVRLETIPISVMIYRLSKAEPRKYDPPTKHQSWEEKRWTYFAEGKIGGDFEKNISSTSVDDEKGRYVTKNRQRARL